MRKATIGGRIALLRAPALTTRWSGRSRRFKRRKAFGRFQQLLVDLPAPRLHDTIPDFHHTPKRFEALERAIASDAADRAILAKRGDRIRAGAQAHHACSAGCESAGTRDAQRHQVQQRDARRRNRRGDLRDRSRHGDAGTWRSTISATWCAPRPVRRWKTSRICRK